jgi:hypothetical protein
MDRMEQAPKTSFIPKQTIGVVKTRERRSFNMVTFLAMVVFMGVLVLSVAVFFYKEYAAANLDVEKRKLADFKQKFDVTASDDIREIRLLEDRFLIAEDLLNEHLSLSRFFEALEERLQSNAQLMVLTYERRPSGEAAVVLEGRALTFNTVALQERGFAIEPSFVPGTTVFSDVDIASQGTEEDPQDYVTFSVSADLDRVELAYRGALVETEIATSTEQESSAEAATSTEAQAAGTTTPSAEVLQE